MKESEGIGMFGGFPAVISQEATHKNMIGSFLRARNAGRVKCAVTLSLSLALMIMVLAGCSTTTGWQIPGTEKSAVPTTKAYLVLENVETLPEQARSLGKIYVDDAFFGNTSRPTYSKFVGNSLVVGKVQIEKEKIHTVKVEFPGYETFEHTRYFGALPEYSISFRLKRLTTEPATISEEETKKGEDRDKAWFEFWK